MATNHNNNALFDGYNLARAKDVRFLAVAMTGYLLGTGNSLKLRALNAARRETITRLAIQMVTDIPLTTAITNLVARDHWSISEKNLVVKLMKKDLEKSSFVRWKRLANNYNNIKQGKGQDAEEAKAWKLVSKSDKLGEQRSAPWRTMSAIRVQTSKLEETKDLEEVARAGETSEVESTDDEKEIPDPKTDSEKVDARQKNRLEAKTKGNTKGKETAGSKGGARTKGNGKRKRQVVEDENTESHGEVLKPAARRRQKV